MGHKFGTSLLSVFALWFCGPNEVAPIVYIRSRANSQDRIVRVGVG